MIQLFANLIRSAIRFLIYGLIVFFIVGIIKRILSQSSQPKNKPNTRWKDTNVEDASFRDISKENDK